MNFDLTDDEHRALVQRLRRTNGSIPDFAYLSSIAIGSKHKVIESFSDPAVVAEERWDVEPARVRSRTPGRITCYSIRLLIRDGDMSRPAFEVFEEAARTWDRLLRQWGYFEARYVDDRC